MWHLITSLVANSFTYATLSTEAADCTIHLPRRVVPNFAPRILPVSRSSGDGGLMVVWQDSESIFLQRYGLTCEHVGSRVEVNRSEDFFRDPGGSGLESAAWIQDSSDSIVVTWTLDGDVWARVVRMGDSVRELGPVVRVNSPQRYSRAEVRVVSNPDNSGFVVAWSSWKQDGDGWGVYARPFSIKAEPMQEEMQVNQHWEHFQWQPQLTWCGHSLWALFSNTSGGYCTEGARCATGPFARRVAVSGGGPWNKSMLDEVNLHGDGPLAAALTCSATSDNATVFWLEDGGNEVHGDVVPPKPSLEQSLSPGRIVTAGKLRGHHQELLIGTSSLEQLQVAASMVAGRRRLDASEETDFVAAGQVAMIAHQSLVILLTNTAEGTLYAQLLDFKGEPSAFPRKQIASGVQFARASWDVTDGRHPAFVLCWASGGVLQDEEPSGFICVHRKAAWLLDSGTPEFAGKLALVIMLFLIFVFCCMRHCSRAGALGHRIGRRRVMTDLARYPRRRSASQARIRELREQLAQIPESPPTVQMQGLAPATSESADGCAVQPLDAQSGASSTTAGSNSVELQDASDRGREETASNSSLASDTLRWTSSRGPSSDACSICQNEVTMWVALRPCGHTACRGCVLRIVEMNQRCHICRSSIEGVLPVYI